MGILKKRIKSYSISIIFSFLALIFYPSFEAYGTTMTGNEEVNQVTYRKFSHSKQVNLDYDDSPLLTFEINDVEWASLSPDEHITYLEIPNPPQHTSMTVYFDTSGLNIGESYTCNYEACETYPGSGGGFGIVVCVGSNLIINIISMHEINDLITEPKNSTDNVCISWTIPFETEFLEILDHFKVYRSETEKITPDNYLDATVISDNLPTDTTEYNDNSGSPNKTYFYAVLGFKNDDELISTSNAGFITHVPINFSLIQDAIDFAEANDAIGGIIIIKSGEYIENPTLSKIISLYGSGIDETILNGTLTVIIPSSSIFKTIIKGLTINGKSYLNGGSPILEHCKILNYIIGQGANALIRNNKIYTLVAANPGSNLTIINNDISSSGYTGVAVSNPGAYGYIANNIIHGCATGIILYNCTAATVINNLIYNNSECGIYVCLAQPKIKNNTIINNIYRGGFFGIRDSAYLHNNIIINNSYGINHWEDRSTTSDYNIIWGNDIDYYGAEAGENDISADPLFVSGPLGDYYLSQISAGQLIDSPALNAGNDTAEELGLDTRTTRIDSITDTGTVDIGYHYPTDSDSDGVPDDGDDSGKFVDYPCLGGNIEFCDDNCPFHYNPNQEDSDENSIGDACEAYKGDVNEDETINVSDVQLIINIFLEVPPLPTDRQFWAADCDNDKSITVADIQIAINKILGVY